MIQNALTIALLSLPVLFTFVTLCYAPAKNRLRYKMSYTAVTAFIICTVIAVTFSSITVIYSQDFGLIHVLAVLLLFILYHKSLTLHVSQSACIYLLSCSFLTFLANFSIIFDAELNPKGRLIDYSFEALIFLIILCLTFCAVSIYPLSKYGSYILDHIHAPRVWWFTTIISTVFYIFNLRMVIHYYSTLHTNMVGKAYIFSMVLMFFLLILLCIIFYFIVKALIEKAETDDRNHILEMQEKYYDSLKRYLDADSKARHDFRQTIYTLTELSEEKDYQAIDEYLKRYRDMLPQKELQDFCNDHALNALLNHYSRYAEANEIKIDLRISVPEELYIDSIDLCSIVGNILENAITACLDVPVKKRSIHAVISEEQNRELYIAISNSFSGKLHQKKDHYISTHKGGMGIGLISVAATASRYNGTAVFSHDDTTFYSDVMLTNED